MMLEEFQKTLQEYDLASPDIRVMLAVSGGLDSIVMTDLFAKSGYSCSILHCNFKLRGAESDGDEAFVRSLAAKYDFPVFVKHFDTEEYADENGLSIQMAARELRYEWFNDVSDQHHIDIIATAHNMNDSVETALINLSRGTGISGVTGIPMIHNKYIRPLLFASRNEISTYAESNYLKYREDSSNAERKYTRNRIRHNIIPSFLEINPSFIRTMYDNLKRFEETSVIYREYVLIKRNELFLEKNDHLEIDLIKLKKLHPRSSWLYELFSDFGFSRDQCLNIGQILDSLSGKQFISPTHRLFKDREKLLLFPVEEPVFERYYIDSPESMASLPFSLDIEVIERQDLGNIPKSANIACLDMDKINFPLIVRKWQQGDFFYPLGMNHMKKVSDFFIDNKVPIPVKEKTWLFTSGRKIMWITGFRIDHHFRITEETKRVIRLQVYD